MPAAHATRKKILPFKYHRNQTSLARVVTHRSTQGLLAKPLFTSAQDPLDKPLLQYPPNLHWAKPTNLYQLRLRRVEHLHSHQPCLIEQRLLPIRGGYCERGRLRRLGFGKSKGAKGDKLERRQSSYQRLHLLFAGYPPSLYQICL